MTSARPRIYCSGPLFNDSERAEMAQIAAALEAEGFDTFLPHRDGLEFRALLADLMMAGLSIEDAQAAWDRAIFALDTYQAVEGCDAVVVNLNGRVPDEGAVAEAAMAWARGRLVVGYKNDVRSLVMGRDNAMVAGLVGFRVFSDPEAIARGMRNVEWRMRNGERGTEPAHESSFNIQPSPFSIPHSSGNAGSDVEAVIELGRRIWADMNPVENLEGVAATVMGMKN
ncbi:MAG: nucleoside 2-deoxyribosyltransferase [Deltaproteobacteria bacterium]|nr:nucleoside 2-deoxyribosyltransferase [Deltaproteobacteria bacterium]